MVSIKTSEQSVATSGLLYEAMGMADPSHTHTQTHFSKCRQISHAFFSSFPLATPPPPPPPQPPFFPHFSFRRESIDRPLPKVIFNQR